MRHLNALQKESKKKGTFMARKLFLPRFGFLNNAQRFANNIREQVPRKVLIMPPPTPSVIPRVETNCLVGVFFGAHIMKYDGLHESLLAPLRCMYTK